MIAFLAGIAIIVLIVSEIAAVMPALRSGKLRATLLWCAVPVLLLFAAVWLSDIRDLLNQDP